MALPGSQPVGMNAMNIPGSPTHEDGTNPMDGEIRTVFVSGLPTDVTERELYLLFKSLQGGDDAPTLSVKHTGKHGTKSAPVAFVTFRTRELAERAIKENENTKFDPRGTQTLRLEFAKSNTKMKAPRPTMQMGLPHMGLPPGHPGQQIIMPGGIPADFANLAAMYPGIVDPSQLMAAGIPPLGFDPAYAQHAAAFLPPANLQQKPEFFYQVQHAAQQAQQAQMIAQAQAQAQAQAAQQQAQQPLAMANYQDIHNTAAMDALAMSKLHGFSMLNGMNGMAAGNPGAAETELYYANLAKSKMGELS